MEKKFEEMNERELLCELVKREAGRKHVGRLAALSVSLLSVVLLISALILVPRLTDTLARANATLEQANETLARTQLLVEKGQTELEKLDKLIAVAEESLASVDDMADNINGVVVENTQKLREAVEKLDEIDLQKLNQAIADLTNLISPLGKLFGRG